MPGCGQAARRALGVGLLLVVGCAQPSDVALLALSGVSPTLIEPGGTLSVAGSGFAAGRSCTVELSGQMHGPGLRPRSVRLQLPGQAESDERVTAQLDRAAFDALGQHGTLRGNVTVAFKAAHGGRVSGRAPLTLDLLQPMAHGAARREALRQRAQALLSFVGLTLAEDSASTDGLVVAWAAQDSVAAQAGLAQGDVIVSSAGVRLHSLDDFAPPPGLGRLTLEVAHSDGSRALRELSLRGYAGPDLDSALWRTCALCLACLLCVAFLSPLPSPTLLLRRAQRRAADALDRPALWGGQLRRSKGFARALALCVSLWASLLLYSAPWLARSLGVSTLFLATTVLCLAAQLRSAAPLPARVKLGVGSLLPALGVGCILACACALGGTRSLSGLVEEQGPWPFQWAAFQHPALWLALPLYLSCAARLTARPPDAGTEGLAHGLPRVLAHVALAALGAAVFAGGWQWPAALTLEAIPVALLAPIVWVTKAWGMAWLMQCFRRSAPEPPHPLWVLTGSALVIVLTAALLWWQPAPVLRLAIGVTTSAATAIALAIALLATSDLPARRPARGGLPQAS